MLKRPRRLDDAHLWVDESDELGQEGVIQWVLTAAGNQMTGPLGRCNVRVLPFRQLSLPSSLLCFMMSLAV